MQKAPQSTKQEVSYIKKELQQGSEEDIHVIIFTQAFRLKNSLLNERPESSTRSNLTFSVWNRPLRNSRLLHFFPQT